MRKKSGIIKRISCLGLVFLLSINSFAAIVSDNDGSAFITKAEFESLKSSFNSQIDSYNKSIDGKIDGAIASYLAGLAKKNETVEFPLYTWMKSYGASNVTFNFAPSSKEWNTVVRSKANWTYDTLLTYSTIYASHGGVFQDIRNEYEIGENAENNYIAEIVNDTTSMKKYVSSWAKNYNGLFVVKSIGYAYSAYIMYFGGVLGHMRLTSNKEFPTNAVVDIAPYAKTDFDITVFGTKKAGNYYYTGGTDQNNWDPVAKNWINIIYGNGWRAQAIAEGAAPMSFIGQTKSRIKLKENANLCMRIPIADTSTKYNAMYDLSKSQACCMPSSQDPAVSEDSYWEKHTLNNQDLPVTININIGPQGIIWPGKYEISEYKIIEDNYYYLKYQTLNYSEIYDYWIKRNFGDDVSLLGPCPLYDSLINGSVTFNINTNVPGKFYITTNPNTDITSTAAINPSNLTKFGAGNTESSANTAPLDDTYQITSSSGGTAYFRLDVAKAKKYFIFFKPNSATLAKLVPGHDLYYFEN